MSVRVDNIVNDLLGNPLGNLGNLLPAEIINLINGLPDELARIKKVADKDRRRIQQFFPEFIALSTRLVANLGAAIENANASVQTVADEDLLRAVKQIKEFYEDSNFVYQSFANGLVSLSRNPFSDPMKGPREHLRILAKKWGFTQDYQTLLGVSNGTPAILPR